MLGDGGQLQDEDHLDQLKKPKKLMKIPGSLVGLAVDDIGEIRERAEKEMLALQV